VGDAIGECGSGRGRKECEVGSGAARYCDFVWAGVFGLFGADILMLIAVYLKVRLIWLRILMFMFGVSLICALPLLLLLLGCGTV
jgi:hypothetical protein